MRPLIFRAFIPILVALTIATVALASLVSFMETKVKHINDYRIKYLLSVHLGSQINSSLGQILNRLACNALTNPTAFTCSQVIDQALNMVNGALGNLTGELGGLGIDAKYSIVNAQVVETKGFVELTMYLLTVVNGTSIRVKLASTVPYRLCSLLALAKSIKYDLGLLEVGLGVNGEDIGGLVANAVERSLSGLIKRWAINGSSIKLQYSMDLRPLEANGGSVVYGGQSRYVIHVVDELGRASQCSPALTIEVNGHVKVVIDGVNLTKAPQWLVVSGQLLIGSWA